MGKISITFPMDIPKQPSMPSTTDEPNWLTIARGEIGQADYPIGHNNPRIFEYLKAVILPVNTNLSDEINWCSAFVNYCLLSAGIQGTHSPAARSFLNWGKPLTAPQVGCITVLKRGGSSWMGHVAMFLGKAPSGSLVLLGGNQGQRVCIENFLSENLLGYRWPNV
jgi:uncharacterized protein (TIGR02594 family)